MLEDSPLRRDLHWLAAQLKHGLSMIETEIAQRHGMSLWAYTVLVEVAGGPSRSQLALAAAVPVDKTKLVAILDELEAAGLDGRRPDPRDRRARLVDPTDAGRAALDAATREIRSVEDSLLADLDADRRADFVRTLQHVVTTRLAQAAGTATGPETSC
ncbi:MarR family winged helix-turn-helix transcriptional regulator [Nonomuraea sp. SBT364]|uniref:MarR family winged helix-turn-helix transcriptional regulator n=1 Tax=Nonomuraea sp. SBT364 TaxID=1580530 RepID=UPI00066D0D9E|nr:MarR family winged helix-turn-helix transcriptional regulator [Nonomuraea sp. SBT364]